MWVRRSSGAKIVGGSVCIPTSASVQPNERLVAESSPVDIMLVPNISKEPNLALRDKHGHAQCMNGSIPESLVIEASSPIQPVKVFLIGNSSEEVQVANFKIREELAIVVISAIMRIEKPVEVGVRMDEVWVSVDERSSS